MTYQIFVRNTHNGETMAIDVKRRLYSIRYKEND